MYPNELEAQPEFEGFSEWLETFDLYRGKAEEETEDQNRCFDNLLSRHTCAKLALSRVVGKFKGAIKAYRLPLPRDLDDHTVMGHDLQTGGFFQVLQQLIRYCFHLMCKILETHVLFLGTAQQRAHKSPRESLCCQGQ